MRKINIYSNMDRTEFAISYDNAFFMTAQTAKNEDYPTLEDSFDEWIGMTAEPKQVLHNWIKEHIIKNSEEDIMVKPENMSEPVRIEFDSKGIAKGFIIPCQFFRKGGKWYMDEEVVIPLDTLAYDIRSAIKKYRRIGEFITVGNDLRGVPFLVLAEED